MPDILDLRLSRTADSHLAALYEYGCVQWGTDKADAYYDALCRHFKQLCENPYLYPAVDHIRAGYRRSICGVHHIYYRIAEKHIEVMAILGAQDSRLHL